jgi:hypothetical protein
VLGRRALVILRTITPDNRYYPSHFLGFLS